MREAFGHFDRDNKGYFDKEDLQAAISEPELIRNHDFELVLKEAFPNGTNKIYYDDFKCMMEKLAF